MLTDERREILQRLARGDLSTDEAERQLSMLDAEDAPREAPGPVPEYSQSPPPPPPHLSHPPYPVSPPHTAPAPHPVPPPHPPQQAHASVPPVAPLPPHAPASPAEQPDGPVSAVRATLSGRGLVEVVGEDSALDVRIDGPHNCRISRTPDGVEVEGDLGDDALLVVPSDAHLELEANSADALVSCLRGSVSARFNVGHARLLGSFAGGDSTIEANVGRLDVTLDTGADVRVLVRCAAHIEASSDLHKVGRGEWQLGDGTTTLTVTGSAGAVFLSAADR